jgi:hypothetical protein
MAYLRYSSSCEWYVFEQPDENLAVWHANAGEKNVSFTKDEILKMLSQNDFTAIPGYRLEHSDQLSSAFREWIKESDYEN